MSQEARVARLELALAAASAEAERQDNIGSLWSLIANGEYEKALAGWDLSCRIAWAIRQGERHHDDVEDKAHAEAYAKRWRVILWGADGQPTATGSQLLSDIKSRLT